MVAGLAARQPRLQQQHIGQQSALCMQGVCVCVRAGRMREGGIRTKTWRSRGPADYRAGRSVNVTHVGRVAYLRTAVVVVCRSLRTAEALITPAPPSSPPTTPHHPTAASLAQGGNAVLCGQTRKSSSTATAAHTSYTPLPVNHPPAAAATTSKVTPLLARSHAQRIVMGTNATHKTHRLL